METPLHSSMMRQSQPASQSAPHANDSTATKHRRAEANRMSHEQLVAWTGDASRGARAAVGFGHQGSPPSKKGRSSQPYTWNGPRYPAEKAKRPKNNRLPRRQKSIPSPSQSVSQSVSARLVTETERPSERAKGFEWRSRLWWWRWWWRRPNIVVEHCPPTVRQVRGLRNLESGRESRAEEGDRFPHGPMTRSVGRGDGSGWTSVNHRARNHWPCMRSSSATKSQAAAIYHMTWHEMTCHARPVLAGRPHWCDFSPAPGPIDTFAVNLPSSR